MNPLLAPLPSSWTSILILYSPLRQIFLSGLFILGFLIKTFRATCSAHHNLWFYHANNAWWPVYITKLLIVWSSPVACWFLPLGPKYAPPPAPSSQTPLAYVLSLLYEIIYRVHIKQKTAAVPLASFIDPLNPELNPICYLLALLGAHHFLHVNRIRVKLLTFRLLMWYIYGAPILDVSRSHTTTQHSR